jgi:hypothetical protein
VYYPTTRLRDAGGRQSKQKDSRRKKKKGFGSVYKKKDPRELTGESKRDSLGETTSIGD